MGGPTCPTYQVLSDGSYTVTFGPPTDTSLTPRGTVDSTVSADLEATAEATDSARLPSRLNPGTCIAPVDGIDITYTWETDSGYQALSTCDNDLDEGSDLMRLTNTLIRLIDQDPSG